MIQSADPQNHNMCSQGADQNKVHCNSSETRRSSNHAGLHYSVVLAGRCRCSNWVLNPRLFAMQFPGEEMELVSNGISKSNCTVTAMYFFPKGSLESGRAGRIGVAVNKNDKIKKDKTNLVCHQVRQQHHMSPINAHTVVYHCVLDLIDNGGPSSLNAQGFLNLKY